MLSADAALCVILFFVINSDNILIEGVNESPRIPGEEIILVQATFRTGLDGWTIQRAGGTFTKEPTYVAQGLGHIELDKQGRGPVQYFTAPTAVISLGAALYGSRICFDLAQPASPGPGRDRRSQKDQVPDVLLTSACGRRIGLFDVVKAGKKIPQVRTFVSRLMACPSAADRHANSPPAPPLPPIPTE